MDEEEYKKYICRICGFMYDEAEGDPDSGLAPGTRFEDIPDDWTCPLCGVSKADMIPLEAFTEQASAASSVTHLHSHLKRRADEKQATVIIGAGIAGWSAAAEIRARAPKRIIIMVAAGSADYYPKPALSMAYAQQRGPEDLIEITGPAKAAELDVILRDHARVIAINRKRKRVLTTRGSICYDNLVLATGAEQVRLQCQGNAGDAVARINDLESYRQLRERLGADSKRIAIIGAGLIGCELAEDLTTGGHRVTLIERNRLPLLQLLPKSVAESLRQHLSDRGVHFVADSEVAAINRDENGFTIDFIRQDSVQADVVITALGLLPSTRLARKAGLAFQRGVMADAATMRTSNKDIYVLGDCAQIDDQCYSYIEPIHRQAQTLAAAICDDTPAPFQPIPPLVRIKTPGLPLVVCPPPARLSGQWDIVEADARGYHLAYRLGDEILGFALSGDFTHRANEMYESIKRTTSDRNIVKPSTQISA